MSRHTIEALLLIGLLIGLSGPALASKIVGNGYYIIQDPVTGQCSVVAGRELTDAMAQTGIVGETFFKRRHRAVVVLTATPQCN